MFSTRFTRYAWFFVAYLLFVILFGAWVRISGSGNGCGSHWPMCHGDVIPRAPETKTIIEFTHRLTSGLSGLLGLLLIAWSRRISPAVFRAALATMFFLLIEAFIGAVLVKKELVAGDASVSRAIVIALHLANTLVLMACASATAWWSMPSRRTPVPLNRALVASVMAALILTNMSGAVTALGDTLFPSQPAFGSDLLAKVRSDLSASHHFLVRLRFLHPVIAVFAAMITAAMFWYMQRVSPGRLPQTGLAVVAIQILIGLLNVALAAPGWMQIVHLLVAQVLWILTFLAGENALTARSGVTGATTQPLAGITASQAR